MPNPVTLFRILTVAGALTLGACDGSSDAELANLDNQITGNQADPALTSALEDQIMVDPSLSQQSNRNAVRPPETPTQAQYPLPQGGQQQPRRANVQGRASSESASVEAVAEGAAGCGPDLDYNMQWARRLPAAFAVYPGSRITDAAGSDSDECRVRVVTFTTRAGAEQVLDWYDARASRAGYSAERQARDGDQILAGTDGGEGAFYLIVTPARGGSEVALIANQG